MGGLRPPLCSMFNVQQKEVRNGNKNKELGLYRISRKCKRRLARIFIEELGNVGIAISPLHDKDKNKDGTIKKAALSM